MAARREVPLALAGWLVVLAAVALLAGLVSLHERHYNRRRLFLIEGRVNRMEQLLIEDRLI